MPSAEKMTKINPTKKMLSLLYQYSLWSLESSDTGYFSPGGDAVFPLVPLILGTKFQARARLLELYTLGPFNPPVPDNSTQTTLD